LEDLLTAREFQAEPFLHVPLPWEKEGYVPMTTVAKGMMHFRGERLFDYGAADHCIGLAVWRDGSH
jgi:predicted GH43/DUF377 family glycosyl hydrolase